MDHQSSVADRNLSLAAEVLNIHRVILRNHLCVKKLKLPLFQDVKLIDLGHNKKSQK